MDTTKLRGNNLEAERSAINSIQYSFNSILKDSGIERLPYSTESATRICVLNLIIYSEGICASKEVEKTVARTFGDIPLRALFITALPNSDSPSLSTDTASFCRVDTQGKKQVCVEQVFMTAGGEYLKELPNTILPLLVPDLPVFLWWRGCTDLDDPLFLGILEICDVALLDSSNFSPDPQSLFSFKNLLEKRFYHSIFTDMNWLRLESWRKETAIFFDDPANLSNIDNIKNVKIRYCPIQKDNIYQPLLFLGWMANLLKWNFVKQKKTSTGIIFYFKSIRSKMEIKTEIIVNHQEDVKGSISEIQLEVLGACREKEEIPEKSIFLTKFSTFSTNIEIREESDILLSQLQNFYHDSVFADSLRSACLMLSSN